MSESPFRANPLLRPKEPALGHPRRLALAASLAFHVVILSPLILLPARLFDEDEPEPTEIVFYTPEDLERIAPPPPPEPEPEPVEIAEVDPPPAAEPVAVEPPPVEPPPPVARHEPRPPARIEPAPPKPRPKIRTDVLRDAAPAVASAHPEPRKTSTGTFGRAETTSARQQPPARTVQRVGGFAEEAPAEPAPVGREDTRVLAAGRFGDKDVSLPPRGRSPRRGSVVKTAFNEDAGATGTTTGARPSASVKQGGFGSGQGTARRAQPRSRPAAKLDTPVAIVSKPKPVYTTEARKLRIEGEVVLEVTFVASGRLRVLRVVGGLGHGLDEAAIEAAEKIEFKPARRNGQPVDHTATLRVVFRLA